MATTLKQLTDIGYDILREEENVTAYPLTFMQQLMNTSQLRICSWMVKNPLTGDIVKKWKLPFLQTDKFYSNVQDTTISTATASGDTTITVADASSFPSTWTLYIRGNIITYTGTTSTTFTGCSNVLFAHPAGTRVGVVFSLPDNYMNTMNVIYNHKFKVNPMQYDDMFEEMNDYKWTFTTNSLSTDSYYDSLYWLKPFYTIKDATYLILFNMNRDDEQVLLRYEKIPTEMSATTDTATIDNDIRAKATIPYLAIGELLFNRGEEKRGGEILNFALWQVKEMYEYYDNQDYEDISWTQYIMWKWKFNI